MLVNQILAQKKDSAKPGAETAAVVTLQPTATVNDAIKLLAERRIGAVVVSEDGKRPTGIVSERDIVREIGRQGADVLHRPVSDLMTRAVMTCTTGDDALSVLVRMTDGRFRHLPVVDSEGEMLGIVSIGDAVYARLKELAAERDALAGMIMGN